MPTDTSVFLDTFGSAFAINLLIEYLRAAPWFRWIPDNERVVTAIKFLAAALLATGIHYKWTDAPPGYQYAIVLYIPSLAAIQHGLWQWFIQTGWFGISEALRRAAMPGPSTTGALAAPPKPQTSVVVLDHVGGGQ